jgi:chorismate mutase
MSGGIRPKGAFPYAALRYSTCWKEVPCYGHKENCPSRNLCKECVHFVGCKDKQAEHEQGGSSGS